MQNEGYLIVLKPEAMLAVYQEFDIVKRNPQLIEEIRRVLAAFDPKRYRGISRDPLQPYPSDPESLKEFGRQLGDIKFDLETDERARRRHREIIGEPEDGYDPNLDEDLLNSLSDAREVLSLLDEPNKWEIIHVCLASAAPGTATLGFDIGYWGGNHFSLIADTVVFPCYHPPPAKELPVLPQALSKLNKNLLFPSVAEAKEFRNYYKEQSWAENVGEFSIIRINSVD